MASSFPLSSSSLHPLPSRSNAESMTTLACFATSHWLWSCSSAWCSRWVLSEDVDKLGVLSDELRDLYTYDPAQLSIALISTLLSSLMVASLLTVYQAFKSTRAAASSAAAERKAAIARGRLSHPPMYDWKLRSGNRYGLFLSHFKDEAGSDARCEWMLLQPGSPVAGQLSMFRLALCQT